MENKQSSHDYVLTSDCSAHVKNRNSFLKLKLAIKDIQYTLT